jgi:hypothetical protein
MKQEEIYKLALVSVALYKGRFGDIHLAITDKISKAHPDVAKKDVKKIVRKALKNWRHNNG